MTNLKQKSDNDQQQRIFKNNITWYKEFLASTEQKPILARRIQDVLREKYSSVWERLTTGISASIFYVGPGNGGVEIPLTKEIIAARKALHGNAGGLSVYCIDSSEEMRADFQVSAKAAQIEEIIPEQNYRIGKFQDPGYEPPKVDLAVASHVWYYIPRDESSIMKFLTALNSGGLGLIILTSKQHDYYEIRAKETPQIYPGDEEQYAEQLLPVFTQLGIKCETEIVESRLTLSSCYRDGRFDPNEKGVNLLSYILRDDWNEQPTQRKAEVAEMLTRKVECYDHQIGEEYIICRDLFIWLPR